MAGYYTDAYPELTREVGAIVGGNVKISEVQGGLRIAIFTPDSNYAAFQEDYETAPSIPQLVGDFNQNAIALGSQERVYSEYGTN